MKGLFFYIDNSIKHVYQPIYELSDFTIIGYEAFIRPNDYKDNIENLFLEAKKQNFLYELDTISIKNAVFTFFEKGFTNTKLFINVFPSTIINPSFIPFFEELMKQVDKPLNRIVLEINEAEEILDFNQLRKIINILKNKGIMFAIDDFGKGLISIKNVIELEPDIVKLDRFFSSNLFTSEKKQKMIRSLVDYFDDDVILILEGIEQPEELSIAKVLGISIGQGYLIGKPRYIENL